MRKTRADPYRVLFFGVSTLDSFHCHTVWTPTECGEREHTLTASNITDMSSHTHTLTKLMPGMTGGRKWSLCREME